jgi:type IV pilus assembly protein PilV
MRTAERPGGLTAQKALGNDEAGFTLLEVILAISILTVGLLAVASMQVSAIRGNLYADSVTDAAALAQDRLENLMSLSYNDTQLASGEEETDDGYTITWTVEPSDDVPNTKIIKVKITGGDLKEDIVFTCVKPDTCIRPSV